MAKNGHEDGENFETGQEESKMGDKIQNFGGYKGGKSGENGQ